MFSYGLVHLILFYIAFGYFGFLLGPLLIYGFVKALDYVLASYGYERLTFGDHCMSFELENRIHNIGGYFEVGKMTHKEFQDLFQRRIINPIEKFSKVQVYMYGTYLWKTVDVEVALKQIIKDDKDIHTEEEVLKYYEELSNQRMDKFKPLWEFRVIENYTETTSMITFRMHHGFIDAVGFVSVMSALDDKQFSTKMDKKIKKLSLFQEIVSAITTPVTLGKILPEVDSYESDKQ